MPTESRLRPWRDFLRLKRFLRPYAGGLALMLLLSLAGSTLGLAQPYLSKYLVDEALLRRNAPALVVLALLMFGATTVGFVLSYISGIGYMRLSASMLFDMRLSVYGHLHKLSPRFYGRARLGDLVSRLNGDVAELQRISADTLLTLLSNTIFVIGSLAVMIWLSWKLFFIGLVLIPVSITLFRFFQQRMTRLARELRERSAEIGALFVETLSGVRLVGCYNGSDYERGRFRTANGFFVSTLLRFQSTSLLGRTVPGTLLTAATIGVFLYGGHQIILGRLTMGTLVAFMAYHARLMSPVQNLLGLSSALSSARVCLGRVLELLDTPIEVNEAPNAQAICAIRRGVEFHAVSVQQEGRNVIDKASFAIPAGRFSAIVGPSGAGKSTIADLMVRLIDPDSGKVTLDGVDIRALRLRDLRETVVLVDQAPHLFHGAIFDNIAYAKPGTPRAAVEEAARAAGLGPLLAALPAGLDTAVGERGLTLSAGERQRVALARAFLSSPEMLILDEPSSALDPDRERELFETLRRRFHGRTVVVITHRPFLAASADYVLRVEDGGVIEERAEALAAVV